MYSEEHLFGVVEYLECLYLYLRGKKMSAFKPFLEFMSTITSFVFRLPLAPAYSLNLALTAVTVSE